MKVRLVSCSQPTKEFSSETGIDNPQDLVAYTARVSNPSNQSNLETAPKLLKYLIQHKHWSPLEMVSATVEIETTRDIARQILRHRSFSFQEFSTRYANPLANMEFVFREARLQDQKNRQNSIETGDDQLKVLWEQKQKDLLEQINETYKWALDNNIAKEQARSVLPEGLTPSRLYMAGTLRSWVHYIELRSSNGTQKEHREIAVACVEVLAPYFSMVVQQQ